MGLGAIRSRAAQDADGGSSRFRVEAGLGAVHARLAHACVSAGAGLLVFVQLGWLSR